MAKLHIHPVGFILLMLGLVCWVIAMAGLAATTAFCNKNNSSESLYSCSQTYQQDWWAVFFELILLLIMLSTCFLNIFPKARYVYLTYLSMVTALLTFTTQRMYTQSFEQGWLSKNLTSRAFDAAGVGAMFLCMVNFALMIFIGLAAAKAADPTDRDNFSSVSTQGPPTGIGMGSAALVGMGSATLSTAGGHDPLYKAHQQGVAPAAPASF